MPIDLIVSPNPFTTEKRVATVPEGGTLLETLRATDWPEEYLSVCIDGEVIPRERWAWIAPHAGQVVTAQLYPRGGGGNGKNIGLIIAGIVLIAASFVPGLQAFSPFLLSAGFSLALSGVVGLVTPVPKSPASAQSSDPRFSLSGARNVVDLFGVVPKVYGAVRVFPKFGALPYTEVAGDDQYLRLLFEVGYGPLVLSELKIGETPIDDFGEVEYEVREGLPGDSPITLYSRDVDELPLGIALTQAGGWFQQTTALQTDEISLDVGALAGLGYFQKDGDFKGVQVSLQVEYSVAGAATWVKMPGGDVLTGSVVEAEQTNPVIIYMPNHNLFTGDSITFGTVNGMTELTGNTYTVTKLSSKRFSLDGADGTAWGAYTGGGGTWSRTDGIFISGKSTSAIRRNKRWAVTTDQYDVRIKRMTADSSDTSTNDATAWTALRSIRNEPPVLATERAMVAMRIKASEKLNGVVDEFNCVASAKVQVYNGTTWALAESNNPAWAYVDTLTGGGFDHAVALSRVDAAGLKAWADDCAAAGRTFNYEARDSATVFERLRMIATAGRAAFHITDGKYGVVMDRPQSTPVAHFTPRNTWDYEGTRSFYEIPHAFKVEFLNELEGFQPDTLVVYDDGYDLATASKFETLRWEGITHPDRVWEEARFHLAQLRLRGERHTFNADIEHIRCTKGDLVRFSHQAALIGLGSGRVSAVVMSGTDNTGILVDTTWTMAAGTAYGVRIRKSDGTSVAVAVAVAPGDVQGVTYATPITAGSPMPEVGDLVMFGEWGLESIEGVVKEIAPFDGLHARLTLMDYAPGVYTADTGDIPAYESHITRAVNPSGVFLPVPRLLSVESDEFTLVRGPDGSLQSQIVLTLAMPSGTNQPAQFYQTRYRFAEETAWLTVPPALADSGQVRIQPVIDGEAYEMQWRAMNATGAASAWAETITHVVVGKLSPPPDVSSFTVGRDTDGTRRFTWEIDAPPPDLAGVSIRYKLGTGHAWADLTPLHAGLMTISPFETNLLAAGTYTIGIKAFDTSGNESDAAVLIEGALDNPRLAGALLQESALAGAWPGTRTDCVVGVLGGLISAGTKTWADFTTDGITWATWTNWDRVPSNPIVYEHPALDVGAVLTFTPLVSVSGTGTPTITEAHSDDDVTYSSFAAVVPGAQIVARYCKIKVSQAHAAPTIDEVFIILDAEAQVEDIQDVDTSTLSGTTGDRRLVLKKSFSLISSVSVLLQNVGPGYSWEVIDKSTSLGPRIKLYDSTDTLADVSAVDVIVRGVA